ncbi:TPA: hypothetical protein ACJL9W_000464, partial [Neisseria meningitidis]
GVSVFPINTSNLKSRHSRESGNPVRSVSFFLSFGQLLHRHSHAGGNLGLSARELMRRHSRESGNPDSSVQKLIG